MLEHDSLEELMEAESHLLIRRAEELLEEAVSSSQESLPAQVWENIGFHLATMRMEEETGFCIPKGMDARRYIALVIAASERTPTIESHSDLPEVPQKFEESNYDGGLDPTKQP